MSKSGAYRLVDGTWFAVKVNGCCIYFTDMMVVNCCADSLWLEMEIVGNQITIYEHEYGEILCLCICDYPIDADAGPFESGTYTLTVYEDFSGLIGSTTFTIN